MLEAPTRSNGDATNILKLLPGLRGGTKHEYSWVLGGGGNNEKRWRWHKHYEGNDRPKKETPESGPAWMAR